MIEDLRGAARNVVRRPGQALLAVTILALGLATMLAVFTYVNGFYQLFPGIDATGLVRVFGESEEDRWLDLSYLDYRDYTSATGAFEGIAAAQAGYAASVRHETMTEVAYLEAVGGDYFGVLGIEVSLGRELTAQDDTPQADPVAVLSHAWWQRSFGGDPAAIGSTVFLNFRPFTVVGVMEPEFLGATSGYQPDVWIPIAPFRDRYVSWAAMAEDRDTPLVRVYGRLRQGTSRELATSELEILAAGLDAAYPAPEPRRPRLDTATWIDPRAREAELPALRMMVAAASVLLLLVCANVANLLLSLATGRRTELVLRAALGASPGRLLRLVLFENAFLAVIAGAIALLLAGPMSTRLGSYFARPAVWSVDVAREASIDLRVVAFGIGIALLTGVLSGLLPALSAARRDMTATLKGDFGGSVGEPGSGSRRRPGAQDLLVTAQVALALVLLVFAGLVVRTLDAVGDRDPGFAYERLVASFVSTSSTELQPDERIAFFREIAERLTDEPWVRSVAIAGNAPLSGHPVVPMALDGQPEPVPMVVARVEPGFFDVLGIDLLRGRAFSDEDAPGGPDVAIVSATAARRFFPDGEAVGRHLSFPARDGAEPRRFEIVGVSADAKLRDFIADPEPIVYLAYAQQPSSSGSALVVEAQGDPGATIPQMYRWLRAYEPHLAIINALPYTEVVRGALYVQRMNAEMFSTVAMLGLALAGVGVFSVLNLAVGRRTREIGVRMAIGARAADIRRMVMRRALLPVAAGVALGLVGAIAANRLIRSLLDGVEPYDAMSLLAGTAVLLVVAVVAAWLPTRRASSVEPAAALRYEK